MISGARENLIQKIETVFSDVPYPECDYQKAIADTDYQEQTNFERNRWQEMTEKDFKKHYDFIFFLEPQGVQYYIAAYMSLILKSDKMAGGQPAECLFFDLSEKDYDVFTNEQRALIIEFLQFCKSDIHPVIELDIDTLDRALDRVNR